ncbi:MAG: hypothetical protein LBT47_06325 [Deltaproteobacteria bacterium]|nr:hypothetical protein [Deltaproteobacteria bacterium]
MSETTNKILPIEKFFSILLSPRLEFTNELGPLDFDLVVSNHAQGGIWSHALIFKTGLFAPDQGILPKYTNREYYYWATLSQLSAPGLARQSSSIPRAINQPEIAVITVMAQQQPENRR